MAKQIICKGKVQGVFFRVSTKEVADQLNLNGWVRNERNGDVFIHVEGEEEVVEKLIEWCWKGPMFSKVTEVIVNEAEDLYPKDFQIRY